MLRSLLGLLCLGMIYTQSVYSQIFDVDSLMGIRLLPQSPLSVQEVRWKSSQLQSIAVYKPSALTGQELWDFLDWAGGSWSEVEPSGSMSSELAAAIAGSKQAWLRMGPGAATILATLRQKGTSQLRLQRWNGELGRAPAQLECRYRGQIEPFADFIPSVESCKVSQTQPCHWVHGEDSRIEADLFSRRLRMKVRIPDADPFPIAVHFSSLPADEQKRLVEDYLSYFRHELSMAVRALLETTTGLFNWQAWHWLDQSNAGLLTVKEVRAMLESGQRINSVDLYRNSCQDGRKLRLWSDLQGTLVLELQ